MDPSCAWHAPSATGQSRVLLNTVYNFTNAGPRGVSIEISGVYGEDLYSYDVPRVLTVFVAAATNRVIKTWDPDPGFGGDVTDLTGDPLVDVSI
jgi:hypothetical protein